MLSDRARTMLSSSKIKSHQKRSLVFIQRRLLCIVMFFLYLEAHVNNRANPASLLESNFPKTTTTTKQTLTVLKTTIN